MKVYYWLRDVLWERREHARYRVVSRAYGLALRALRWLAGWGQA